MIEDIVWTTPQDGEIKDKPLYINKFVHVTSVKNNTYFKLFSTISTLKLPLNLNKGKKSSEINPWLITGFIDAEGCFSIRVRKTKKILIGWHVEAVFSISLHLRDLPLLEEIQAYFGGIGRISKGKNCGYFVSSIKDLTIIIIPHLIKYPLITKKQGDFLLFNSSVQMIKAKKYLTMEGLQNIVSNKASINLGLTDELKAAFPNTIPAIKSLAVNTKIPNSYWMAGFTSGDGCFSITVHKSSSKFYVRLVFSISQHNKDESLIRSMVDFFGCGSYIPSSLDRSTVSFQCYTFSDNYEKIIPFFRKYNIKGDKSKDFDDWCKIAEIIKSKDHLTKKGFDQIILIKSGMNKGR